MSNWTNEPDGDGFYWLRLGEDDTDPCIVKLSFGSVYEIDRSGSESVEWYLEINARGEAHWQWQKVKPCEP